MFFKYLNIPVFLISICVGLFVCYVTHPKPRIILKCPNPDNEDKVIYEDEPGNCYKYKSKEVLCPKEELISSCFNNE